MDIHEEFKARMARDVARTMRHLTLSGLDVSALNGVILTIQDGQVVIAQPSAPAPKARKGKAAVSDETPPADPLPKHGEGE